MMAATFWTLFFFVIFLMLVVIITVFAVLDGIRYHEDAKRERFREFVNQDTDWTDTDD